MRSFRCVFRPYRMNRILTILLLATLVTHLAAQPQTYEWTTPSKNASESMPCGGGDVGLNVWTEENGDVLFYLSRSGCFDENNTLLKLGRFRIHLTNPLKMRSFRQQLVLKDGYCQVTDGQRWIVIWVRGKGEDGRGGDLRELAHHRPADDEARGIPEQL